MRKDPKLDIDFWDTFFLINTNSYPQLYEMSCSFCLISSATNRVKGWYIFHVKGGKHSSIWSTKTFVYDDGRARNKQNNMGYQTSKI